MTIGVAVAIPAPFAAELRALARRLRRPAGRPDPGARDAAAAHAGAPRVASPAIREHLHARRVARTARSRWCCAAPGSFRPVSHVVFVQVAEGIAECEQIEREVRSGLLDRDLAFYYHPHVTVAHDLPHDDASTAPSTSSPTTRPPSR